MPGVGIGRKRRFLFSLLSYLVVTHDCGDDHDELTYVAKHGRKGTRKPPRGYLAQQSGSQEVAHRRRVWSNVGDLSPMKWVAEELLYCNRESWPENSSTVGFYCQYYAKASSNQSKQGQLNGQVERLEERVKLQGGGGDSPEDGRNCKAAVLHLMSGSGISSLHVATRSSLTLNSSDVNLPKALHQ